MNSLLTIYRYVDGGQEEGHPRPDGLVPGGRGQEKVIAGEGDDVEGVLAPVDGLEERLESESFS